MPEHQQTQQSKNPDSSSQRRIIPVSQSQILNPAVIIQRARINPKSLTPADVLQLQRTIGNRAVGRLLSETRNPSKAQQVTIQRQEIPNEEEELLQSKMAEPVQRQEISEEEEALQGKMIGTIQRQKIREEEESIQTKRENNTGMSDNLKAGVESLSGIDMSDVRVHYNSSKPAEVGALAYTQGTNIHVAPEQERHLPHEAWHVVQQKQGRVKPALQMKGIAVNDDVGLEREADVMGENAVQRQTQIQRKKSNRGEVSNTSNQDINIGNQDVTIIDNQNKLIGQSKIKSLNDGSKKIIQRHIRWVNPPGQFIRNDGNRPGWMDGMGAVPLLPGQSLNHIIDFEDIQNDLVNILNALVIANTPANRNRLTALTDALMPSPGVPRANMVALRNALIVSITAGTVANYDFQSRALLSRLNSSPDNVRAGNAVINQSIGQNIDADFNPGTHPWVGGMVRTTAAPLGILLPAQNVLTLTPASNNQVYRYQEATTQLLSFVINPLNNRQLSSVTGPTVGHAPPYPVLVTDPAAVGVPFLFM